jgi:hypothetical protein
MRTICTVACVAAGFLLAATQAPAASPAGPAPVADADLAEMSGGQASNLSVVWTTQTQTATNGYNTVSAGGNVSSGDVNLGPDSLQGFAGIGNFVINTGHNNNLQGNLSVAIDMMPTAPAGTR